MCANEVQSLYKSILKTATFESVDNGQVSHNQSPFTKACPPENKHQSFQVDQTTHNFEFDLTSYCLS